mgnify:CR=1 FL=1
MIIGFTGTQQGMTQFQKTELINIFNLKGCTELLHGDCVGSDAQANELALQYGTEIFTIYPPDSYKKRAFCFDSKRLTQYLRTPTPYIEQGDNVKVRWYPVEPYLTRNKKIVDACSLLIATPKEFKHTVRSGTWSTIRYAWKTKKDLVIIPPVDRGDTTP